MCAKPAEDMAKKSANVGHRKGRKRKITEEGREKQKESRTQKTAEIIAGKKKGKAKRKASVENC